MISLLLGQLTVILDNIMLQDAGWPLRAGCLSKFKFSFSLLSCPHQLVSWCAVCCTCVVGEYLPCCPGPAAPPCSMQGWECAKVTRGKSFCVANTHRQWCLAFTGAEYFHMYEGFVTSGQWSVLNLKKIVAFRTVFWNMFLRGFLMPLAVIREHLRVFEHHKSNLLSSYSVFWWMTIYLIFFWEHIFPLLMLIIFTFPYWVL